MNERHSWCAGAKTYRRFHSAHRLGSLSHEKVCSLDSWPSRGMTYMIHWITFERRAKIGKGAHRADRISRKHSQVCKYRWLEWRTGLFHRSQYTLWDETGRGEVGGWGLLFFPHVMFFKSDQRLLLKVLPGLCAAVMTIHHIVMHPRQGWNDPRLILRTVALHTFTATIHVWGGNAGKKKFKEVFDGPPPARPPKKQNRVKWRRSCHHVMAVTLTLCQC